MTSPLGVSLDRDGTLLRLRLSRPKANIVDASMIAALEGAFEAHRDPGPIRACLIDAEGPHFSFGASVEEHLADRCAAMLEGLHRLLRTMLSWPRPVLFAVRGQCLGGGLELCLAGSRLFVSPDAQLGQPEIKLAVFAPAASALLPFRLPQPVAEDLLLTGRSLGGAEAVACGLAQALADDPEQAALAYFDQHLAPKSASSLGHATLAARTAMLRALDQTLPAIERRYLDELMKTHDANEGLAAFMAKRPAVYSHR